MTLDSLNERIEQAIKQTINTCQIGSEVSVCDVLRDCQKQLASQVEALKLAQDTIWTLRTTQDKPQWLEFCDKRIAEISKHLPTDQEDK